MLTYLPKHIIYWFIVLIIFLYVFVSFFYAVVLGSILFSLVYYYRKFPLKSLNQVEGKYEDILSPCSGIIEFTHLTDKLHVIGIRIPVWERQDFVFPIKAEVSHLELIDGEEVFSKLNSENYKKFQRLKLGLKGKNHLSVSIEFIKKQFVSMPRLGVQVGDIGQSCASFGHCLFGGIILLSIPREYMLLFSRKEKLQTGSVIASKDLTHD